MSFGASVFRFQLNTQAGPHPIMDGGNPALSARVSEAARG